MTTDAELRALAEASKRHAPGSSTAWVRGASPDRVLALLDEVARLEAALDYIARYDPGREDRWATVAHLQDYADTALLRDGAK